MSEKTFEEFAYGKQTEEDVFLGRKLQELFPGAWIPGVENGGIGMFIRLLRAHTGGSEACSAGHDDLRAALSGGAYSEKLARLEAALKEVGL